MKATQEQIEKGKSMRTKVNRTDQSVYKLPRTRKPVVDMIIASNEDRLPDLIPIRHYRMSVSPFAFYRGTANIMAYDLFHQPHTDLNIQSVGDCHLMNFGGYATPERSLVFDINDFDETYPAPWEWDLKRLATSFILAANDNDMHKDTAEDMVFTLVRTYQKYMQEFSNMTMLDLWYMKFDLVTLRNKAKGNKVKTLLNEAIVKAGKKTPEQVFYKITRQVLGKFEITEQPPLVYHPYDLDKVMDMVISFWNDYLDTLLPDRRFLVSHYQITDLALKVVGTGSVGTRCFVVLLMNEKDEPLFIQVKEARSSVLEAYTKKSTYEHHGQRVVEGQRLIQAASDIFLGWSTGPAGRHFYFRQLKDKKITPEIERFDTELLEAYARLCGRTLARAHAKTGNAGIISAYIGKEDKFNEAVVSFAKTYAKQVHVDYEKFIKAVRLGKLPVNENVDVENIS